MKRIEQDDHARYLTFSCYRQLPLLENDRIKDAFVEQLQAAREKTEFHLLAWVVMPEHVHVLIWPRLPEYPVSKVSWTIKRSFAQRVIGRWPGALLTPDVFIGFKQDHELAIERPA